MSTKPVVQRILERVFWSKVKVNHTLEGTKNNSGTDNQKRSKKIAPQ